MRVAIELDDFSPVNHNLAILEELRSHFPNFKVTVFTVPWECSFARNAQDTISIVSKEYKPFVEAVNKADWIEVALHGLTHMQLEFSQISYKGALERVTLGMRMLEEAGIKNFTKIFKAPQWEVSDEAEQALKDLGFVLVKDGYYNWNLADESPKVGAKEPFIMHGHIQNVCDNGISERVDRVLSLPTDTEFLFLSDVLGATRGFEYYGEKKNN